MDYSICRGAFIIIPIHLELSFFAYNIFDEKYLVSAGNTGNLFGIPTFVPGSTSNLWCQIEVGLLGRDLGTWFGNFKKGTNPIDEQIGCNGRFNRRTLT